MADYIDNHIGLSSEESSCEILKNSGLNMKHRVTTSPEASSTASESPTPTNSVHEKNWSTHWQSLVSEEQRELLGTEEESSDRQSDAEQTESVWEMSSEQKDYYKAQFIQIQPDINIPISGSVARAFFEKSKLSLAELRKIWQLADVSRDGALSLDEFMVAMHLVVLRRNNIEIPDKLPSYLENQLSATCIMNNNNNNSNQPHSPVSSILSAHTSPHHNKQWTKFIESPTSSISSPGPKPVNFDFHKASVEQDPKILHPVAVRVTPNNIEAEEPPVSDISPIRPIQRPQPKKHSVPGPGAIPPPPPPSNDDNPVLLCGKKDAPPPPPPRPYKQHTRSSSLDLTRLGRAGVGVLNMPPVPPPRTSPSSVNTSHQSSSVAQQQIDPSQMSFANFAQFPDETSGLTMGAFHVYRKPSNAGDKSDEWTPIDDIPLDACLAAREAHNAVLRKICHQLQTTLSSLQEERALLQTALDRLLGVE